MPALNVKVRRLPISTSIDIRLGAADSNTTDIPSPKTRHTVRAAVANDDADEGRTAPDPGHDMTTGPHVGLREQYATGRSDAIEENERCRERVEWCPAAETRTIFLCGTDEEIIAYRRRVKRELRMYQLPWKVEGLGRFATAQEVVRAIRKVTGRQTSTGALRNMGTCCGVFVGVKVKCFAKTKKNPLTRSGDLIL